MTTYRLNEEKRGVEIVFDAKPAEAIRDELKESGFRWGRGYWYAKQTPERIALAKRLAEGEERHDTDGSTAAKDHKLIKEEGPKTNRFGVKVGDLFSASWGYDQTNNDFFQVVELVGSQSVRVREVQPRVIDSTASGPMGVDMVIDTNPAGLLPAAPYSVFIKDQERGDLKRLKSYRQDGVSNPQFNLSSFCDAHYCGGKTEKIYESWTH